MKKMNLKKIISAILFFSFACFLYGSSLFMELPTAHGGCIPVAADGVCGAGETSVNCPADCAWAKPAKPGNVPEDFNKSIMNLTNWILGFVSLIAVLALIWGGVNYLTSAGDEDKAKSGKKIIEYAIMGIVIAGLAYALVVVIVTVILVN